MSWFALRARSPAVENHYASPRERDEIRIFYLGQKYEFLLEHLAHNVVEMKGNDQGCTLCESVCRFVPDKSEMGIIVFGKSKIVCVEASWDSPGLSRYIDTAVRREEGRGVFCQVQR